MAPDRTFTIDTAAQLLGVSRRTVYHMLDDGRLTAKRVRAGRRITERSMVDLGWERTGAAARAPKTRWAKE